MIDSIQQNILNFKDMMKLSDSLPEDDELRSHWTRYMCVRAAGLLERSFISILAEYVEKHSDTRVTRRVAEGLERISNPNISVIRDVFGHFDERWKSGVNDGLDQKCRDSVNTIMANRNHIAHGRDVHITPSALAAQFHDLLAVIEYVHELVLSAEDA